MSEAFVAIRYTPARTLRLSLVAPGELTNLLTGHRLTPIVQPEAT